MKRNIVLMVLSMAVVFGSFACSKTMSDDTKLQQQLKQAALDRIDVATALLRTQGMEAATNYCKSSVKRTIASKGYWITCNIAAEFFDPRAYKVVSETRNTIFPIGIYARSDNALGMIHQGYGAKDISVNGLVYSADPTQGTDSEVAYVHKDYK